MNQEKVIYCAGFFDGEGHIRIAKHSKRGSYMLQIIAVQATPQPLDVFEQLFGGTTKKRLIAYRGSVKAMFTWQASSMVAQRALEAMLPHLIVKHDEAKLALEFRATFRPQYGDRSRLPEELESRREGMKDELQEMRKRKREIHLPECAAGA